MVSRAQDIHKNLYGIFPVFYYCNNSWSCLLCPPVILWILHTWYYHVCHRTTCRMSFKVKPLGNPPKKGNLLHARCLPPFCVYSTSFNSRRFLFVVGQATKLARTSRRGGEQSFVRGAPAGEAGFPERSRQQQQQHQPVGKRRGESALARFYCSPCEGIRLLIEGIINSRFDCW